MGGAPSLARRPPPSSLKGRPAPRTGIPSTTPRHAAVPASPTATYKPAYSGETPDFLTYSSTYSADTPAFLTYTPMTSGGAGEELVCRMPTEAPTLATSPAASGATSTPARPPPAAPVRSGAGTGRPAPAPRPVEPGSASGGTAAERGDTPHGAGGSGASRREGARSEAGETGRRGRTLREPAGDAATRRQRDQSLMRLALPARQAASGAARVGRQPLFLAVRSRSFSAPRSLDTPLPAAQPKDRAKRQGEETAQVDPAEARQAFANAARQSETLFTRILAAADQIGREANRRLQQLTNHSESALGRALARLDEDLAQRRLDAAARRDFRLDRIAARTDQLRFYVVQQANRALGRMAALRTQFRDALAPWRSQTNQALGRLSKAFSDASQASNDAHFAIQGVQANPATELARDPLFAPGSKERGPAMVEAMLEAAVHYAPPRLEADDQALADRLGMVSNFVEPILACARCEVDGKLQSLEAHAENLGVAGPRAIRSARDGAIKSINEAEDQLKISVLESHRQTENMLVERRDQTRQTLIDQTAQATAGLRRDIDRTSQKHIDALTGVAATQPAAVAMVHGEIEKAAAAAPTRAAALGVQASARLQRNIANVRDRHPAGVLGMAERNQAGRIDRAEAGARQQEEFLRGFDQQQIQFIRESFDQVGQSVEESLHGMAGMPGQVGSSCDSMVRTARQALQKAQHDLPQQIGDVVQRLNDACDGLIPPPRESPPANPNASHAPPPSSLVCTPADEPNMSLFTPGASSSPMSTAASSPVSGAPPSGSGPAAAASPGAAAPAGGGGGTPPASCGPCESAQARARAGSGGAPGATASGTSGTAATSSDAGGAGTPASGAGDVGVSSARTNMRSPRAYKEYCEPIKREPHTAPNTAAFLVQVNKSISEGVRNRVSACWRALDAWGETDNGSMMKNALRGLTAAQGRALSEAYLNTHHVDLAQEIRNHAHDSAFTDITTDIYNRDAALAALEGRVGDAAINELRAAFNFSNERDRIFEVMQSMSQDQRAAFVAEHRAELEELMTQLSDEDQSLFRQLMEGNTVRARSTELKGRIDDINRRYAYGSQTEERGREIAGAITRAETGPRWALEGPSDRVDIFGLEDPETRDARNATHWREIQQDFAYLDGVADAIARSNPAAAVSRPDDPPGAALIAYSTRPLEIYRIGAPVLREGETREQALARQREEYARWNVELGDEQTGEYGTYRTATTSLSEYQRLWIEMIVVRGANSREARAAHTLAEFRRRDGRPPSIDDVEAALHSGITDAREGGGFEHGSPEAAERDRLQTFALAEQYRRRIEGGAIGPVDPAEAKASFRREMEAAYRDRPQDLAVALGVIDSNEGNMQAVIDRAIAREDPALLTRYLGRMDSNQIEAVVTEWNRRHPNGPGLYERLGLFQHHWSIGNMNGAAFTGDEANALEIAIMGVPQTDLQRAEVALRVMNQQIEQAGWLGRLTCSEEYDALVENANHLREVMGVTDGQVDQQGRVRLTDRDGNQIQVNFDANGQFRPARGSDTTEFEMVLAGSRLVADNYANAVDRMASMLTTIIAVVGAIVLTVATFGAGASVLVAMAIAAGFGALTIAVNASMRGGRYSRDDLTRDVVAAAIQIATAGLNVGIARGLAAGAKLGGAVQSGAIAARSLTLGQRLAVTASRHALATAMLTQGAIGGMSNLASTALDPAMRRRDDYGDQVMHSFFRGFAGGAVTAGVAHGLNAGASAVMQRYAASRAVALAMERGASRAAATRLAAMSAARMASGRFMEAGVRGLVNATSATAGRAAELGYENLVGIRRHSGADFYRELRHAFIQNAIQGIGEGMALRGSRRMFARHAEEHARQMQAVRADAAETAGRAFDREMSRQGIKPDVPDSGRETAAPPPRAATPDEAAQQAAQEARVRVRPAEEPAARRPGITDETVGTSLTRRPAPSDEGVVAIRGVPHGEADAGIPAGARMRAADEPMEMRSNIRRPGAEEEGAPAFRSNRRDDIDEPPSTRRTGKFEDEPTNPVGRLPTLDEQLAEIQRRRNEPGRELEESGIAVATADLTRARLEQLDSQGHRIPMDSEITATDRHSREAALRNYHALREHSATQGREVLLAYHPQHGYVVIQGGLGKVTPRGGDWVTLRHSHPEAVRMITVDERVLHGLPSGRPGDVATLMGEAARQAALPENGGVATRVSTIDVHYGARVLETEFSVAHDRGKVAIRVEFTHPDTGTRHSLGPFHNIDAYAEGAFQLFNVRIPLGDANAPAVMSARQDALIRRGAPVSVEERGLARSIAERASEAAGLDAPARAGRMVEIHDMVRNLGLVGREDSLARLTNLLNVDDPAFTPAMRAAVASATLEATRAELIRTGQLAPGDDVLMLLRGVMQERLADYESAGINLARLGPGMHEDAGFGLYGSQDFESARRYTGPEGGGGQVLPLIVRRSELGNVIDVRSGTPLGGRWLQFLRASGGKGRVWPEHGHLRGQLYPGVDVPIALERDFRGSRFEAFLKSIADDPTLPESVRSAARDPHLTLMDLGGVASTGNDRGVLTDQWAMHRQRIADLFNEAHGFPIPGREGPGSVGGGGEGNLMRSNIGPRARPAADPEEAAFSRQIEQAFRRMQEEAEVRGVSANRPGQPAQILPEGWALINNTIAAAARGDSPDAMELRQLLAEAPEATRRILHEIATESLAGRSRTITDNDVFAIEAELIAAGRTRADARSVAANIAMVASPAARLHQTLSEAAFSRGLQSSLREPLGEAAAERSAVRAARDFADRNSPTAERRELRRLLDIDTEGVVSMIVGEGSWRSRAMRFAMRRVREGASFAAALRDGYLAARILRSQAFENTADRWQRRAAAISPRLLADLIKARPDVLLSLARTSPRQLSEWFADYILRQPRSAPPVIDADGFARYVQNRQISNILPIVSEASSVWSNFARLGLRLLKADAVQRGGANRPGLDLVGFGVDRGARPQAGDLVRVVIIDDKAYRGTSLEKVSAMTGLRLPTNLRASAAEIEAGINALMRLGEHVNNPEIADYIAGARQAIRQMRNAARELDEIRPPPGGDMRNRAYLSKVGDVLRRNNIIPLISSEYGNVRILAQWLRAQGFRLTDEYARILAEQLIAEQQRLRRLAA